MIAAPAHPDATIVCRMAAAPLEAQAIKSPPEVCGSVRRRRACLELFGKNDASP